METTHELLDLICLYCDRDPVQEGGPQTEDAVSLPWSEPQADTSTAASNDDYYYFHNDLSVKCPAQFSRVQVYIFKCLVLTNKQSTPQKKKKKISLQW